MSSSIDAGATLKKTTKNVDKNCPQSPDGNHEYEVHGSWPSTWGECKHCGDTWYSK